MFETEFEFSKFPAKWLAAQGRAHALRHRLGKQVFVKGNEKNICMKETYKILEMVNSSSDQ